MFPFSWNILIAAKIQKDKVCGQSTTSLKEPIQDGYLSSREMKFPLTYFPDDTSSGPVTKIRARILLPSTTRMLELLNRNPETRLSTVARPVQGRPASRTRVADPRRAQITTSNLIKELAHASSAHFCTVAKDLNPRRLGLFNADWRCCFFLFDCNEWFSDKCTRKANNAHSLLSIC